MLSYAGGNVYWRQVPEDVQLRKVTVDRHYYFVALLPGELALVNWCSYEEDEVAAWLRAKLDAQGGEA